MEGVYHILSPGSGERYGKAVKKGLTFTKMHGLGNDFVLVEDFGLTLSDYGETAKKLCDRHYGIGADGLVLLQPSGRADCKMRIFNADGTEAEMCGNAVRCVGKYLYERRIVPKETISLETFSSVLTLQLSVKGGKVAAVTVNMGQPELDSEKIPVRGKSRTVLSEALTAAGREFRVTAVSMGNPHCVIFVPGLHEVLLEKWGPAIEEHPQFPRRTNVEFVYIASPREAHVLVWERGVGPTLACGSGACAVLVAGVLNNKLERRAQIRLPGGCLSVFWADDGHVYMTGPAQEVFSGVLSNS